MEEIREFHYIREEKEIQYWKNKYQVPLQTFAKAKKLILYLTEKAYRNTSYLARLKIYYEAKDWLGQKYYLVYEADNVITRVLLEVDIQNELNTSNVKDLTGNVIITYEIKEDKARFAKHFGSRVVLVFDDKEYEDVINEIKKIHGGLVPREEKKKDDMLKDVLNIFGDFSESIKIISFAIILVVVIFILSKAGIFDFVRRKVNG
ncbi:MAG: hypothetical protein ABIL45_04295 [candidate division WOR-3 bacterium]